EFQMSIPSEFSNYFWLRGRQREPSQHVDSPSDKVARNGVTPRQKPDLRRRGVTTSHIPLFQLVHTQMLVDRRQVSASRLMARQTNRIASTRESPSNVESISRKPYDCLLSG